MYRHWKSLLSMNWEPLAWIWRYSGEIGGLSGEVGCFFGCGGVGGVGGVGGFVVLDIVG